jgi:hypothetical protein
MGRAARKFLGRFFGSGLGWKHTGIGLGWFLPRPRASHSESIFWEDVGSAFYWGWADKAFEDWPRLGLEMHRLSFGPIFAELQNRPSDENHFGDVVGISFWGVVGVAFYWVWVNKAFED